MAVERASTIKGVNSTELYQDLWCKVGIFTGKQGEVVKVYSAGVFQVGYFYKTRK
jgi:hypothetical protein